MQILLIVENIFARNISDVVIISKQRLCALARKKEEKEKKKHSLHYCVQMYSYIRFTANRQAPNIILEF